MSRMRIAQASPKAPSALQGAVKMATGIAFATLAACNSGASQTEEPADTGHVTSASALVGLRVTNERAMMTKDPVASAIQYMRDQRAQALAGDWLPISTHKGIDGNTHVRVTQTHAGIPIFGGDVVVHLGDGKALGANGNILTGLDTFSTSPTLTAEEAKRLAKQRYLSRVSDRTAALSYEREQAKLVILPGDHARPAALAWHVTFRTELQGGVPPGLWNHFYDAASGSLLWEFNGIDTLSQASGPGGNDKVARTWQNALDVEPVSDTLFEMNTLRLVTINMNHKTTGSGSIVRGPLDPFGDAAANDAHGFSEATLDMLRDWQGYESIDNAGFVITSRVHYGVLYENAFWNGSVMTYGDGGGRYHPFSGALDVVSHELHHGFTSFHSNLTYAKQPGGMNESFSDIAGEVAEAYHKGTAPDFLAGADIVRTGEALRFMCNPTADGVSIDHFSNYNDSKDVHYTSGIMNKAFCLAARRIASGRPDGAATRESVLRASRAWYLANAAYWTSSSTFVQGCQGVVDAAEVLGMAQNEVAAIGRSWQDVGVTCRYPLAWMTGDVNGDGRADLIEPMENGAGMVDVRVSLSSGSGYSNLSTSANLRPSVSSLAWLKGDVNGDGKVDLIQTFDNGGGLGINVYASTGSGFGLLSSRPSMGQGSGALTWLTGDVNGDGRTDLIQPFDNGGRLGLVVYQSNGTGLVVSSVIPNIGQGSGALAWLTGDVNGDGRTDLIQPFDNGGRLGMIIYRGSESGFSVLSGRLDLGQGSGGLGWLVGDVNADGRTDLIEPFDNNGRLGMLMYTSDGTQMVFQYGTLDMGQGSDALSWLMDDANGDGKADVMQPWANTRLGLIMYASTGTSLITAFGSTDLGPLN